MPIHVTCPNGCAVRLPSNLVGKRVRCPECRVVFQVDPDVQPPRAESPISTDDVPDRRSGIDRSTETSDSLVLPTVVPRPDRKHSFARNSRGRPEVSDQGKASVVGSTDWLDRSRRSLAEKKSVCRIFAALILAFAAVNVWPAAWAWFQWWREPPLSPLPIWCFLLAFGAAWQALFAILLLQVPDWSALRASAAAMLVVIAAYSLSSAAFALSGRSQWLSHQLQLSNDYSSRALLWCIAMVCLAIILSLSAARESQRWRRIELLTASLLAEQESQS